MKDISTAGIGLICRRSIEPGTNFFVKMQSNYVDLTGPMQVLCVQAEPAETGWLIGCKFSGDLSELARTGLH